MEQLDFIPFGAQYYRAPTPTPEHWEPDIRRFAAYGFNTIKIWAQWRWNNPEKGVYDFSDLHRIMDLCEKYGVRVVINVILDVEPVWFAEEFPESAMLTNSGERLYPQTTAYRQIGGAPGPCYNHPEAIRYKREFVEKLAAEFAGHPALLLWDLWNEPELTCGIRREPTEPSLVCYCDHCRRAFTGWLKKKYRTVEKLNGAWERCYRSFEQAELPRASMVYQDMIDWRSFYADVLQNDLHDRAQAVRTADTVHPVMVHTVPSPLFNMVNACCDDYRMAKECDLFGNSVGSAPFPAALSVSGAKGKTVLNAEIHAYGGTTFNRPAELSYDQLKRIIFTPYSIGIKGFLFWQYRPETLGAESPAWGMVDLEGNSTPCTDYSQRIQGLFTREKERMLRAKPAQSRIAVIKDNYNEIFDWCVEHKLTRAQNSLLGCFNGFYNAGYNVDVLTSDQLEETDLSCYQLICYPFPYYMRKATAECLRAWVAQGGTLVSEAFFGAYCAETGLHSEVTPGYGFREVFGAKEIAALSASNFRNAYGAEWSEADRSQEYTTLQVELDGLRTAVRGYFFEEAFEPSPDAEVIARFASGRAAAVRHKYGRGQALLFGSMIGYAYQTTGDSGALQLFDRLAGSAGVQKEIRADRAGVRCDVLTAGAQGVVILTNDGAKAEARVTLAPQYRFSSAKDADSGAQYAICGSEFVTELQPDEVKILLLD